MIKLIELFGGIGTQAMTLKRRFADKVELVDLVEWDKRSVKLYNAIHGTNHTTSDAQLVRGDRFPITHNGKDIFVMTCSSPCQSLSNAGDRDGMEPGHNKKSSLLWEGLRILRECRDLDPINGSHQPHYFMIENVVGIHNKKNNPWFQIVLDEIRDMNYDVHYFDINGYDIGAAQSRNRTFVMAVLKGCGLPEYKPFKSEGLSKEELHELRVKDLERVFANTSLEEIEKENSKHKIVFADYGKDPDALSNYPFLVAKGLDKNPEFTIIDKSFQSQKGIKDDTKCRVYTDKFPTLMCKTEHLLIIDTYHKLLRNITAHEAWKLQNYSDKDFEISASMNSYTSLHKTAGDAILIDALDKVIEQIPTEANPNDVYETRKDSLNNIIKSRQQTYDSAFNKYNRAYNKELSTDPYTYFDGDKKDIKGQGNLFYGMTDKELFESVYREAIDPNDSPIKLEDLPDNLFDDEGNQLYNCAEELQIAWQERDYMEGFINWFKEQFGYHPGYNDFFDLEKYYNNHLDKK